MFDIPLADGLTARITAHPDGVFRLRTGGHDGFPEGLLERYGLIERLPEDPAARLEGRTVRAGSLALEVPAGGGFRLLAGGSELAASLPGTRPATFPTVHGNRGWRLDLAVRPGERLVGFGDQQRTRFLLNGTRDELWLRYPVKHVPVPCFFSDRGYGVLFNTTRRLRYDIAVSDPACARFAVEKDFLDCWIFAGDAFDGLIERYTRITGRPPLPPLKSFGPWLLFHTQATGHEVLLTATRLREAGIPCDNLGLEPGWMERYYDATADKEWNAARFRGCPHPVGYRAGPPHLVKALGRQGYALGLWLCSRWDFTWEEERRCAASAPTGSGDAGPDLAGIEISHHDENVGHAAMWLDEVTRRDEPWFAHLRKFVDDGARFFKVDPAWLINEWPDRLYGNGRRDDEMHNIAFLLCSKQMAAGYETATGRRSYGIAVAGWTGFQRFAGTWAGDTGGGAQSLTGILQDAVLGHSYATCDMAADDVRGLHMGYLLPWSLLNSWAYFDYPGCQGPAFDAAFRDYARLRMRLLPYLYSLAWRSTAAGRAMARPLFLEWPQAEAAYAADGQFLLGDGLLVTCYRDRVRLPPGRWFDWWSHRVLTGAWDEQTPPIPAGRGGHLLVRAGALVPLGPEMLHTDERPLTRVDWLVFPGDQPTAFTLYRDQGDDLGHRQGAYATATLSATPVPGGLDLAWSAIGGGEPQRIAGLQHAFEVLGVAACSAHSDAGPIPVVPDPARNRCLVGPLPAGAAVHLRWTP